MKKCISLILPVALSVISCQKYDDSDIRADIDLIQKKVVRIEEQCIQINSNIASLQSIVNALQNNTYVSSVKKNDLGYDIIFTNGSSITIYNGKDGIDGKSPTVSVKEYNGRYYWTIDGCWIYDGEGHMIPTTGADGKDAITPQLKIVDGYWFISTDNGQSWDELGIATGADGKDGETIFSSVTEDDKYVYFTLENGATITLPKEISLAINFINTNIYSSSTSMIVPFTLKGAESDVQVVAFADKTIEASIELSDNKSGNLRVKFLTEELVGNIMIAVRSKGQTIYELVTFQKGILASSSNKSYIIPASGQTLKISISRNMEVSVNTDVDWIKQHSTRSVINEELSFIIEKNNEFEERKGKIFIESKDKSLSLSFDITQEALSITDLVLFSRTNYGTSIVNGAYFSMREFTISNESQVDITIKKITSSSAGKWFAPSGSSLNDMPNKLEALSSSSKTEYNMNYVLKAKESKKIEFYIPGFSSSYPTMNIMFEINGKQYTKTAN